MSFAGDQATLLRDSRLVEIETSAGEGRPVHRTVIWIVVDDDGRAYVRSWRGTGGRWYRELVANPKGGVHAGGDRIAVRAVPADEAGIAACSRLLRAKYRTSRASVLSMVRDEVLRTTLELVPA